ncbi:DinB family protein [Parasediminibacterium paludis]|uniref:DinB family protein n=1 Tax=Parasediminibacterium paludis TaxID=908966 RepID=A0ABV8PUP6_9BACT
MLTQTLNTIFTRDLKRLQNEIAAYQNEQVLWLVDKGIANSGGNLCLHLLGNINAYIGAVIGNSGYVRNRPLEFTDTGITKADLLQRIDATIATVNHAFTLLTEEDLLREYPMLVLEQPTTYTFFLVHLAAHLSYHLGQINYHRRLLDV